MSAKLPVLQVIASTLPAEAELALKARCSQTYRNVGWSPTEYSGDTVLAGGVTDAEDRLRRFARVLVTLFPELGAGEGLIESPLYTEDYAAFTQFAALGGRLLIKADSELPVTGSIKARGGVYEVLKFAETVGLRRGLLSAGGDLLPLTEGRARDVFSEYRVVVGSTGNLGYSIGLMARALGLRAEIYMSVDAKEWKKDRLRALGAKVIEVSGDYSLACADARETCSEDPMSHFIDDEESMDLFLGYATAAARVGEQLNHQGIAFDEDNPLYVFLPCGVGGAPGGITYGLSRLYGAAVRCVWVEPTDAPCFLLKALNPDGPPKSVYDLGLTNRTVADGLAVPKASEMVFELVSDLIYGYATVSDDSMLTWMGRVHERLDLRLEPSAAAGFAALEGLTDSLRYEDRPVNALVWTTGGSHLPDAEFASLLQQAQRIDASV